MFNANKGLDHIMYRRFRGDFCATRQLVWGFVFFLKMIHFFNTSVCNKAMETEFKGRGGKEKDGFIYFKYKYTAGETHPDSYFCVTAGI